MATMPAERTARRERLPVIVLVSIGAAWVVAIGAELTGQATRFGHHRLNEGGWPGGFALAMFVLSWQVMLAAMMLPSSLGMVRAFGRLADTQPHPIRIRAAFLSGYAGLWTVFGLAAFVGDASLHRVVEASAWLRAHGWLIGGCLLVGAGAFQFTGLKDRCLTECRTPVGFLMQRYRPGARAALRIGVTHGVFCVGCCWALMLVAFAVGAGNLLWMAVLTTIMVIERSVSWGASIVRPVGLWLLVLGTLVLLRPIALPGVLSPT